MTKLLVSGLLAASLFSAPAFAADLGVVSQTAPAGFETHDWTGFYAGVFGGVSTGTTDLSATGLGVIPIGVPAFSLTSGGELAGVQVGGNYQMDQFVLGGVADFALTNYQADLGGVGFSLGLSSLATVRARAGYAFDNVLAYVHGGVAYGHGDNAFPLAGGTTNADHFGYTVGAGIEYAVNDTISLQTEYSYTNLGKGDVISDPVLGSMSQAIAFHTVKAGINFSF